MWKNLLKKFVKRFGLLVGFSALSLFLISQDAAQSQSLTLTSLNIKEELQLLRQESLIMNAELQSTIALLEERSNDLRLSEGERIASQTELTELYISLRSMTEKSIALSTRLLLVEEQLAKSKQKNFWLWFAIIVMWALKIGRITLGFAKPSINKLIPLWLDIII